MRKKFIAMTSSQSTFRIMVMLEISLYSRIDRRVQCTSGDIALGNIYDPSREYDFETHWPINIDRKLATFAATAPVQFTTGPLAAATIYNTGKSVIVRNNQQPVLDTIRGGVFGNDIYLFELGCFYWVNDTKNGRAGTTINRKAYPLELCVYYWNKKYGNFTNAMKHRDGMAVFDVVLDVVRGSLSWSRIIQDMRI